MTSTPSKLSPNAGEQSGRIGNLSTFFCLYIAQNLPMSFFSTVIPVMMRQEAFSLTAIGMLQLIKLPWILKFLWSPLVDRHTRTVDDYKRWIFSSELLYACLIFAVAFLDFKTDFPTIMVFLILAFMASATQDIATDALAVLSFRKEDKSLINSMQSMGSFSGSLLGGGLLLILFKMWGWNTIVPFLGLFVLIALVPLFLNRKIAFCSEQERPRARKMDLIFFFTQKGIWKQIVFLLLYYAGLIGTLAMLKPYLVDLGYNMHDIGIMSGVIGTFTGFAASFAGGFLVRRIGLFRARRLFAFLIVVTTGYFYLLSYLTPNIALLHAGVMLLWGSYGLATIVVYTSAMEQVRQGREGTDFTLQTVMTHLSGILLAIASGKIADAAGYHGLFLFELIVALTSFVFVFFAFKRND